MINGTYNILYIDYGDGFYPIGLLTSNDFTESTETLDTTTRDNNGWTTQVGVSQSYSVSFSGLVEKTGGEEGKINYTKLVQIKRSLQIVGWKIESSDSNFVDFGEGQITDIGDSSNIDEFVSFNATLKGYGAPYYQDDAAYYILDGNGNIITDGDDNGLTTS